MAAPEPERAGQAFGAALLSFPPAKPFRPVAETRLGRIFAVRKRAPWTAFQHSGLFHVLTFRAPNSGSTTPGVTIPV